MFDFLKFYNGLLNRTNYFNNYWEQFPKGRSLQFKKQVLDLLEENIKNKDGKGLAATWLCPQGELGSPPRRATSFSPWRAYRPDFSTAFAALPPSCLPAGWRTRHDACRPQPTTSAVGRCKCSASPSCRRRH